MSSRSFAEYYHQATKYDPESVAQAQRRLDFTHQPAPFKLYSAGRKFDLRPYLLMENSLASDSELREARDALAPEERLLAELSHILYFTNGITAIIPYPDRSFMMRAAPSAGGLYPTELYLALRNQPGLPDGLYHYQVRYHALILFWEGDAWSLLRQACFEHPALDQAGCALICTGIFERSSWRYQDRAYRRIMLDTGHILGNLHLFLPQIGRTGFPIGGFWDDKLNDLLFLDGQEEAAIAVTVLPEIGVSADLGEPVTALPSGRATGFRSLTEGYRLAHLHGVSRIDGIADVPSPAPPDQSARSRLFSLAAGELVEGDQITWKDHLAPTILRRRSTRAYTGEAISRDALAALLSFTYRPDRYSESGVNRQPRFFDLSLLQTFVAISDVEGLEPGCYHYSPEKEELRQIRFKNFSKELQYLCLDQELGGQASAVVFHTADLPAAVTRYGDRAYRYLHLDAGHLGERLNIAAIRLGLGASGIGGFFDDQVNELLGIPEREAVLYVTTIGRPEKGDVSLA